jgi:hypothetical protein
MKKVKERGIDTSKYKEFLSEIEKEWEAPDSQETDDDRWDPRFFEKSRGRLISMILDAERKIN